MVKAKVDFLWYKQGDEIKDSDKANIPTWKKEGLVEGKSSAVDKIKDIVEDIADDGKLNNSNKKKKSKK